MTIQVNRKEVIENEETRIQTFIYQMLASRVFLACYIGRFYVDQLKSYRDVLQIESDEKKIISDLLAVRKRIAGYYSGAVWPAITGPEPYGLASGYCIWVRLHKTLPLNKDYWFKIDNVAINQEGELIIQIKPIRKLRHSEDQSPSPSENVAQKLKDWNYMKEKFVKFLDEMFTWHNTKETARFLLVLVVTLVTVALNCLQYLGDFSLRFFREFNHFVHVSTPIFIALLDVVKKTIGGLFLLVAMFFRGISSPGSQQGMHHIDSPKQRMIGYNHRPF